MCHHSTPRRSSQGIGGVLYGGPLSLPPRGTDVGSEEERPAGGGGPGRDNHRGPSPRCASTATGDKVWGLADSVAVHVERYRARCAGMLRCPLPEIWP